MVDYFVRVPLEHSNQFNDFCKRSNLRWYFLSAGFIENHAGTSLYRVLMTNQDATVLKMAVPVTFMEAEHG